MTTDQIESIKVPRVWLYSLLIALCAGSVILNCFNAASYLYTDNRLMPLFMFRDHQQVYLEANKGPLLDTLYPPLSVLLYAPVALFNSPESAFFTAGLLTQVFCFLPLIVGLYLSRDSRPQFGYHSLLIATGFMLWCNGSDVLRSVYFIHADPPALFLTASGILAYIAWTRSNSSNRLFLLFLSAFCCSLAPWAKQVSAPAVLIVPILLLLRKEFRLLAIYVLAVAFTETIMLVIAYSALDLKLLFLWILTIPSKHPWKSAWSVAIPDAIFALLYENLAAMTVLGSVFFIRVGERKGKLLESLQDMTRCPWVIFALAGVLFWPTSVLGFVKVGGATNALLYSTYCMAVGLALLAFEALTSRNPIASARARAAVYAVVILLSFPMVTRIVRSAANPSRLLHGPNEEAYNFSRQWPGQVFFPWHPLSVYLAEGKIYNFEWGVCDRVEAGISIDRDNFSAHLPSAIKYVAFRQKTPQCTLALLPEFNKLIQDPRLPGWSVYARR